MANPAIQSVFACFVRAIIGHRAAVVIAWALAVAGAAPFALRLARVAQGGSEAIRGSEAHAVLTTLEREFGRGFPHLVPVILTHETQPSTDPAFAAAVGRTCAQLRRAPGMQRVFDPWQDGLPAAIGRDGKSVVILVQPDAATLAEAEAFTAPLRRHVRAAARAEGFTACVTGMSSMYHDLNHRSATDLLHAEMVGVPLTLLVLFLVFRTAVAAALALAIAGTAVTLSSAALCLLSPWLPASVLAQNVITMIGLGAGTDYALFLLSHYRHEHARGVDRAGALVAAFGHAAPAVLIAGLAVAGGFAALFLVNARFMHSLALGGVIVIAVALAATLTLLPALLHFAGDRVFVHPKRPTSTAASTTATGWAQWARFVMRRPWPFLGLSLGISVACAWPILRTHAWDIGPTDLAPADEARVGYELLQTNFEAGWIAPVAITLQTAALNGVWTPASQRAVLELADELGREPRLGAILGFSRVLAALGPQRGMVGETRQLPPGLARPAATAVSADGRTALLLALPRESPSAPRTIELIGALRERGRPSADAAGLTVKIGGGSALIRDFDTEMFSSAARVMAAVITMTFIALLLYFRSLAVPLKAIAANLLSVFAAYGFLVVVFQDGFGTRLLGIAPPGGLNSFVILMLFTILFGLSMDYEIFLLSRISDEFRHGADNTSAVARGVAATAGIITSAAAIMVCLFGSFGFFGLTATRQFGLGLAFAVAFDATIVRLLIVPATMRLLGAWNWWLPHLTRDRPGRTAGLPASRPRATPSPISRNT